MRITFTLSPQKNQSLIIECPEDGFGKQISERTAHQHFSYGSLQLSQTLFKGVSIVLTELTVKKPTTIKIDCDCFCWMMNFVIDGEAGAQLHKSDHKLLAGRYHTFYAPAFDAGISCNSQCTMLTILLSKGFIKKIFGDTLPTRTNTDERQHFALISGGLYLNGRLEQLVNDILKAGQPPHIKRIFLEARVLELLSLQLHQLEPGTANAVAINRDDEARLNEARLLVEQNLKAPCSLSELSRRTGLNDFKLKKGFKALFGNTVFGYLGELRMTKAYQLLQNGERVSTVADTVGYKNAHHFTAAFKKRYKILPSQVVRTIAVLINLLYCI